MLEIIGLFVTVTGIGTLARGRGTSPEWVGSIAVAGWVIIRFFVAIFFRSTNGRLLIVLASWTWVALIAGILRFVVGASRPKPDSKWNLFEVPLSEQRKFGVLRGMPGAMAMGMNEAAGFN